MELYNFVKEQPDTNPAWENLFSKSDIVFLENISYEQFKNALAKYFFETQYSQKSLDELLMIECEENFNEDSGVIGAALLNFLHIQDRPKFNPLCPDQFMDEFKKYFTQRDDTAEIDITNICQEIQQILIDASDEIRDAYVNFNPDNLPDKDSSSYEFAHMTGLLGEVLAKLVFEQMRGCGNLVRTKINPDNPNMPRHGEDLIAFAFDPSDSAKDILHLVESKSSQNAVSTQIDQIKERFSHYLHKLPRYEINRLKIDIQHREKEKIRTRITRLVNQARKNPNHKQVIANAFLHYPLNYNPQEATFKKLGDIQVTKKDGTVIKMDADRVCIITFRFGDFEKAVREIFEKAWTI